MTEDVRHFAERFAVHRETYSDNHNRQLDFAPGAARAETEPVRRTRRGAWRRRILLLFVIGMGWALYADPSRVVQWGTSASGALMPLLVEVIDEALPPARPPGFDVPRTRSRELAFASASSAPQMVTSEVQGDPTKPRIDTAPAPQETTPETPKVIATLPPVKGVVKPEASPQPTDIKIDRDKSKARSVGLHPGLSPVVLAQLSARDFRNADYAIRTALAKTADDKTFKWPRERQAKLAMYEVRFVEGAAKGCRRYVVTIEKNRWLTTALPMEKCGAGLKKPISAARK